jgi:alpha-mannosidase
MGQIETFYILNHSHTDIGFTDYQDLVFRQHAEFIDQAIDLCERTADYPQEAQYRWTCEVTGTTERYLETARPAQLERFKKWHEMGRLDVGAMQYNFTPLLGVEQMYRSLLPVRRLRERWGLNVDTAMQSDVNGIAWLFADLLLDMGVDFLSMSINPVRGGVPKPYPTAFWWEAPSGRRLLVWNGYHYLFGRSVLKLGDWRFAEREVADCIKKLESRDSYPFDFLFFQSTHPMRVDNGPPDLAIADFVRKWNELGNSPRLQLVAHREFAKILRARDIELPVMRGEWMDWWCDGVGSTAYETAVSRECHQLLGMAETLNSWARIKGWGQAPYSRSDANSTYEQASLYDEHTWGAYASVAAPHDPWTKGQENAKTGFAYRASASAHDMLAKAARKVARSLGEGEPGGRFNLGDITPEEAYPLDDARGVLVLNTLPWSRQLIVDEPAQRGGAAPVGMLDMFFPQGVPWGGEKPDSEPLTVQGDVAAWGYAYLQEPCATAKELQAGPSWLENGAYRIEVDPARGGLAHWVDKASGHDLAGSYRNWALGQYVYEQVTSDGGRIALFTPDFSAKDFGSWRDDVEFTYDGPSEVSVHDPEVRAGRARLGLDVVGPGVRSATCTFTLWQASRRVDVEWVFDKVGVEDPESVFFAFPFTVEGSSFLGDFNGIPCVPDVEQLPGSVRSWYPVQGWIGLDGPAHSVVLVPLDAPLVHLGGVNTGRVVEHLDRGSPVIMSWALNNHWFVNFAAQQDGRIRLRYSMTSMPGHLDAAHATRFSAEVRTPPVVLRDRRSFSPPHGAVCRVIEGSDLIVGSKVSEDGSGVVLRLLNGKSGEERLTIDLGRPLRGAWTVLPDERADAPVQTEGPTASLVVGPRCSKGLLLKW